MSTMTEGEARDAYVKVVVEAVNNRGEKVTLTGKPLTFGTARLMIVQRAEYIAGKKPEETLIPMLEHFCRLTGITAQEIEQKELGLGAVIGVMESFFYHMPTVTAGNGAQPPVVPPST